MCPRIIGTNDVIQDGYDGSTSGSANVFPKNFLNSLMKPFNERSFSMSIWVYEFHPIISAVQFEGSIRKLTTEICAYVKGFLLQSFDNVIKGFKNS